MSTHIISFLKSVFPKSSLSFSGVLDLFHEFVLVDIGQDLNPHLLDDH